MNKRSVGYCIKQGLVNIKRNKLYSLASIGTIAASIFLITVIFAIILNLNYMEAQFEKKVGVTVFFEKGISEEQIKTIGDMIEKDKRVDRKEYTSAEQAWDDFKKDYFGDEPDLAKGFAKDNPLADSAHYTVYLKNLGTQDDFVNDIQKVSGVRKVKHSEEAKDTLANIKRILEYISIALIIILLCVGVFLINNTVMLGINVRREEIKIMKLIGSSNNFVRAPFVIEGVVIGLIGSIIPLIVLALAYSRIITLIVNKFGVFASNIPFAPANRVFSILIPLGIIMGAGIGLIGSALSIRKHLKV